jgi:hypothetical protein
MNPNIWLDMSRPSHLTIDDVLGMPLQQPVRIFFMDRNVLDLSANRNSNFSETHVSPSRFFRNCYYIDFTRTEGIRGTWKWLYNGAPEAEESREFDIDMGTCWFPLRNGEVYMYDDKSALRKHYSALPGTTRLGWRGPMMLASVMDSGPDVNMPAGRRNRSKL